MTAAISRGGRATGRLATQNLSQGPELEPQATTRPWGDRYFTSQGSGFFTQKVVVEDQTHFMWKT